MIRTILRRIARASDPGTFATPAIEDPESRRWYVGTAGHYETWEEAVKAIPPQPKPNIDYRDSISPHLTGWDGYLKPAELGLATALLSALSALCVDRPRIIDFGGGMGVHFKTLLKTGFSREVSWQVLELAHVAEIGTAKWAHRADVSYSSDLKLVQPRPNILIASGVLQFIAEAESVIDQILNLQPTYIALDRVPLSLEPQHYVSVQTVGAGFYGVEQSVPVWVFSKRLLLHLFSKAYQPIFAFEDTLDPKQNEFVYEGMLLKRVDAATVGDTSL